MVKHVVGGQRVRTFVHMARAPVRIGEFSDGRIVGVCMPDIVAKLISSDAGALGIDAWTISAAT